MAFGWKTEYEKRMPADGLSNWEIFAIAERVCKQLDWEYLVANEKSFTATTPTNWTLNEEIITIQVEHETLLFKSKSESIELLEAGRNQKNIEEELLPAFKKARTEFSHDELQQAAAAIKSETLKQLKTGNRVESEKIRYGFKDHEITFLLIAIQVVVFIVLAVKGVNIKEPSTPDVILWGGSMRLYITGGEWWRLLTAVFVNAGIVNLLANVIALYFIGLLVESILGKVKFLIAFLCAGILANLLTNIWLPDMVSTGSSGAIFGMYGVFLAFATTKYINKNFPKVWLLTIVAYVIFCVATASATQVNNALNFAGLIAGICIGYLFYFFHFKRNIARAGGTRISIEILLVTCLLVFLYVRTAKDDSIRFEKAVMKLNRIEVKAMTQMQRLQYESSNEDAAKLLKDSTLPEWQNFKKELVKTNKYRLDEEFTQKRNLLNKYAALRLQQTELIYKSIEQGDERYKQQVQTISDSIDLIIDQLGY